MPSKSAKKKPSAKPRKSPVPGRRTNARAKDGENTLTRLRQQFEKALNARNELLKQAEAVLRESKEQAAAKASEIESLLNVIPIPIWIARTPDCRRITGNQAAAELIGAALETNVSQTPGEHPVEIPMVCLRAGRELRPHELPMQQAAASGQPVSDEFEIVLPDGRVKSLCGRAIPLKDAGGIVTGVIAAFTDITERKQVEAALQHARDMLEQRIRERTTQLAEMNERLEEQLVEGRSIEGALRESERRFRAFWDHAPNLAFVKGADGRYLYVNRKFEDVFRFERGSVRGRTDLDLFPRGQADQFQAHDRQVLESGQAKEFEEGALYADGLHTSIVVKFPLQDATGQVYAIGGIATDITDRKRTEAVLREKEELTRAFLENSTTVAWMKDAEGRYVYLSSNCERRFGLRFEDWQGKTDFELWPVDVAQRFRDNDLLVLQQNRVIEVVEEVQDSDGGRSWWLSHRFPYQDASGRRYVGGLGVEITEQKLKICLI
jgi:PAS domain S-box-containing protein